MLNINQDIVVVICVSVIYFLCSAGTVAWDTTVASSPSETGLIVLGYIHVFGRSGGAAEQADEVKTRASVT